MNQLVSLLLVITVIGTWFTSFVYAIKHSEWVLLLVDCVFFPAGVVHGLGLWLGWW